MINHQDRLTENLSIGKKTDDEETVYWHSSNLPLFALIGLPAHAGPGVMMKK